MTGEELLDNYIESTIQRLGGKVLDYSLAISFDTHVEEELLEDSLFKHRYSIGVKSPCNPIDDRTYDIRICDDVESINEVAYVIHGLSRKICNELGKKINNMRLYLHNRMGETKHSLPFMAVESSLGRIRYIRCRDLTLDENTRLLVALRQYDFSFLRKD